MTDHEEPAEVNLENQRKVVFKQIKAVGRLLRDIHTVREKEKPISISMTFLRERNAELTALSRRANRAIDLIFEHEEDEGKIAEDDKARMEFNQQALEASNVLNNLGALKRTTLLSQVIEEGLTGVEDLVAADDTTDCSACLADIQKQLTEMSSVLVDCTIPPTDTVWDNLKLFNARMLKAKAQKKPPPVSTTTIIKSDRDRDFDTPKVNIPKFKGGLEAWFAFWSRFKAAVHDNEKIKEPVKMAILLDLMEDPALKNYLVAQSDGQAGR